MMLIVVDVDVELCFDDVMGEVFNVVVFEF